MYCIKCGREIQEEQIFCETCLEAMQKYPVKPGTAVQLPQHRDTPGFRKTVRRRQGAKPEEQILKLKKTVRRLVILWLITALLLAATIYPTVEYFLGEPFYLPGQNYSTITDTKPAGSRGNVVP